MTFIEEHSTNEICVIEKVYKESKIVLVYNIGREAIEVNLKDTGYEAMSIRGYLTVDGSEVILNESTLNLPKYAIGILK